MYESFSGASSSCIPHNTMRLHLFLAALAAPCVTHSFSLQYRAPIGTCSPRASSCNQRCSTNAMMTLQLPSRLNRLAGTVLLGGTLLVAGVAAGAEVARADVSLSPVCVTGEGAQCDDLAEGNEYIKSLQAKSALSKDKLNQETLDKYNDHNFKDYFRAENKHMVRHKDGKYEIYTNDRYTQAEKEGKVKDDVFLDG